jgi:hypothetical protein
MLDRLDSDLVAEELELAKALTVDGPALVGPSRTRKSEKVGSK